MSKKGSWHRGFMLLVEEYLTFEDILFVRSKAMQCEHFSLGVPDDEIYLRIFDTERKRSIEDIVSMWKEYSWIQDVIVVDKEHLPYDKILEEYEYDVIFYGSDYGKAFCDTKKKLESKNVTWESLLPDKMICYNTKSALDELLSEPVPNRKIILFGTGAYFDSYIKKYGEQYPPTYAIDNQNDKWGTKKSGITIKRPDTLKDEIVEDVLVIVCAKDYQSMVSQLRELGEYDYRLMLAYNPVALLEEFGITKSTEREILKKIQDISLDMLKNFDAICRKHNIEYSLNFGSILGAVRHRGFIPWDNDVDVVMKRDEYLKFAQYKEELDDKWFLHTADDYKKNVYYDCVPRLMYKYMRQRLEHDACDFYDDYNNRLDVDLFFIDKTRDDIKGRFQRWELAALYGLMNAYRHETFFVDYDKRMRLKNEVLCFFGKFFSLKWLRKKADRVARRFNNDSKANYYFISNDALSKLYLLFPEEIFNGTIDIPFEDMMAMGPSKPEEFTRLLFGDYEKLPSPNARIPHRGRIKISSKIFEFSDEIAL